MEGIFRNYSDKYNQWPLEKVLEIATKVKEYADKKGYKNVLLHSVEDWSHASAEYVDSNDRIDIEIRYLNEHGILMQQKLLMMKGEIIDGNEFHKRHDEFYPCERRLDA